MTTFLWWRICLIKLVLMALPLYFISFFKMPSKVIREINKIQRFFFLWGGGEGKRKMAWVSWENICQENKVGGLG